MTSPHADVREWAKAVRASLNEDDGKTADYRERRANSILISTIWPCLIPGSGIYIEGQPDAPVVLLDPAEKQISLTWQLANYWLELRTQPAQPHIPGRVRGPAVREYGHPQEWASDKAAEIVQLFDRARDMVADACGEPGSADSRSEAARLAAAFAYLHAKRELLPQMLDSDLLRAMLAVHTEISETLGLILHVEKRGPCPKCGEPLSKYTGETDLFCECGYQVEGDDYEIVARAGLDATLDATSAEPLLVTIEYAAKRYNLKRATIDTWLMRGKLTRHGKNKDGRVLVDAREIANLSPS
jgi:hypothetical protein